MRTTGGATGLPRVSVITVVKNAGVTLNATLDSVFRQDYPRLESIVIDGGSTDATASIIGNWSDRIAYCRSEPDRGIADAMNKGLRAATGDLVLFLHGDDRLAGEAAISSAITLVDAAGYGDVYACCVDVVHDDRLEHRCGNRPGAWMNLKQTLPHQGALCRRDLFERHGAFDETFRIAMDYEFFLRVHRRGASFLALDHRLSVMGGHGISNSLALGDLTSRLVEEKRAHDKHTSSLSGRLFYRIYWYLYPKYKSLLTYGDLCSLRIR